MYPPTRAPDYQRNQCDHGQLTVAVGVSFLHATRGSLSQIADGSLGHPATIKEIMPVSPVRKLIKYPYSFCLTAQSKSAAADRPGKGLFEYFGLLTVGLKIRQYALASGMKFERNNPVRPIRKRPWL